MDARVSFCIQVHRRMKHFSFCIQVHSEVKWMGAAGLERTVVGGVPVLQIISGSPEFRVSFRRLAPGSSAVFTPSSLAEKTRWEKNRHSAANWRFETRTKKDAIAFFIVRNPGWLLLPGWALDSLFHC
jgi:hypothetical protein